MIRALNFAFIMDERDPRDIVQFIRALDLIMRDFDIAPITWQVQEIAGPKTRWEAFIASDCRAAFDRVTGYLIQHIREHAEAQGKELLIRERGRKDQTKHS